MAIATRRLLMIGVAIAHSPFVVARSICAQPIIPDNSLGVESSRLRTALEDGAPIELIEAGAARGPNLFHSFEAFGVNAGQRVYFANPSGVEQIFSRVTGNSISRIDGTLGVLGTADLFLLNPNGMVFGPGARLDLSGSFTASTASAFEFTIGSSFDTAASQDQQLLTVNVPLGLQFNTLPQGDLTNDANLIVDSGQSLNLLGNTLLSEGRLVAPGGTVRLLGDRVGLRDRASIDVSEAAGGGRIFIGGDVQGGDELLSARRTFVGPEVTLNADALTEGNGGQVVILSNERTAFFGEVSARGGHALGQGGFVEVSGKQELTFQGKVDVGATNGEAGLLLLDPENIRIVDGAGGSSDIEVATDSEILFGDGPANGVFEISEQTLEGLSGDANLILQATNDIVVEDLSDDALSLAPGAGVIQWVADADQDGAGDVVMQDVADTIFTNGRNLAISGVNLTLGNIDTDHFDGGDAGSVNLNATGNLSVGSIAAVGSGRLGRGGDVKLNAGRDVQQLARLIRPTDSTAPLPELRVEKPLSNILFGSIDTSSKAKSGSGGTVTIMATGDIRGTETFEGSLENSLGGRALGQVTISSSAGDLSYSSESRFVGDGGEISLASVSGNIVMEGAIASSVSLYTDNSESSVGNGGNISVVSAYGKITVPSLKSFSRTNAFTEEPFFAGNGGDISVYTRTGDINIPEVDSLSSGAGSYTGASEGGAISISSLSGDITITGYASSLSFVENGGTSGLGGDILISSAEGNITVGDGNGFGRINSGSFSEGTSGNAGEIRIQSESGDITIDGSVEADSQGLFANGASNGENVTISSIEGDIVIGSVNTSVSTFDAVSGDAGDISISSVSGDITIENNLAAFAYAPFEAGDGGDISIKTDSGSLVGNDSSLFALSVSNSRTSGNGGSVTLEASYISDFEIFTLSATEDSGNVRIQSDNGDLLISDTKLTTTGQLDLSFFSPTGNEIILDLSQLGQSGNTLITSNGDLFFQNVEIQSDANGLQSAGNITIESPGEISFTNSQINSNANNGGNAGQIRIDSARFNLGSGGRIFANSTASGNGGSITINATESIFLSDGTQNLEPVISVEASDAGRPGSITLNTPRFVLSETARITATSTATATNSNEGGSITLNASQADLNGTVGIFAETEGQSPGGTLTFQPFEADRNLALNLAREAQISAETSGSGPGGEIRFSAPESLTIRGAGSISAEASSRGSAGQVDVRAQQFVLDETQFSTSTTDQGDGGSFNVQATESITLLNGAELLAQSTETASGSAGSINLNTTSLEVMGDSRIATSALGVGNAGDIAIQPSNGGRRLAIALQNGEITAATSGSGNGGDLTLNAPDAITISGNGTLSAQTSATGSAGNITVTTDRFTLDQGTQLTTTATETARPPANTTFPSANINLNANDMNLFGTVQILSETQGSAQAGSLTLRPNSSGDLNISLREQSRVSASTSGSGRGGSLRLAAPNDLSIRGDGTLSAETSGSGPAGQVQVQAQRFALTDKAKLSTSTSGSGAGGNLNLDVSESVTLRNDAALIAQSTQNATGKGGDINLEIGQLRLDNSSITVRSLGTGDGGNIDLDARSAVLLRNQSLIETDAGGSGNGGNIDLTTLFLLGFGDENSDIIANARSGNGGQINITANNIFNFDIQDGQNREQLRRNSKNDVSASSETGTSGTIALDTLNVDPAQSLAELPSDLIDASSLIDDSLCAVGNKSEFLVTGRGGLPASPGETIDATAPWEDWSLEELETNAVAIDGSLPSISVAESEQDSRSSLRAITKAQLIEAKHWQRASSGEVILYADASAIVKDQALRCRQLRHQL